LLSHEVTAEKLLAFTESKLNVNLKRPNPNLRYFEVHDVGIRFQIAQCAFWLMLNWPNNVRSAWLDGAVRYNLLLKDMKDIPEWYRIEVEQMNLHYKRRKKIQG
jgi:hypothetical protein